MIQSTLSKKAKIISWSAQLIAAFILGQAAVFKLVGVTETRELFTMLGAEPWGRIGTGTLELLAVALLLTPRLAAWGGVLGATLMVGAIGSHLTKLGIVVAGDGGTMFAMALITLIASLTVIRIRRDQLPFLANGEPEHANLHAAATGSR